ncbi:uncharacterized protein LOC118435412 [Folsomia candida]|uniref:uncharacterized protein LOC118435412 n=1 Tax=Folsomia candida TaxID=158441 RepID=UPI001604EE98|nr:uncharacterized protein LOC118435412 [Folsomia candida]
MPNKIVSFFGECSHFRFNFFQTGSNNATTEEKMRRIIEMTVLICGITVVVVVFFLSVRISAHLFKKFKIYSNQRLSAPNGNGNGNEMSVHYSNGRSANGGGSSSGVESSTIRSPTAPAASLYAVMPGHFLHQPCYPGSSRDPPTGSGSTSGGGGTDVRPTSTTTTTISTSRHVDGTYRPGIRGMSSITTQIEDDAQIHHHIAQSYASTSHPTAPPRAETPPPPYPGPTKDEVKGQSDQKINNQLKNRGKNVE